ncbi:hypothetical protein G6F46_014299 [Rhizopus delemar]|nr:hypothetical protein G6F46_014299 [Rhizopus delemar]
MVAPTAADAKAVQSQVKRVIRTIYSSPSTHGAALVAGVLTNPDLRKRYADEGLILAPSTPAELSAFLGKEVQDWAAVIKQAGVKLD